MKSAILALFGLCLCGGVSAQTYSIDWFTIDGGGGTSTGGVYTINGTIGQSDAGRMTGGSYAIEGGFWSILGVVQTPGGPTLRVVRTTTNTVVIAWPSPSTGFSLQQNSAANNAGSWSGVTNIPVVVGSERQVTIAPPVGNRYFRLKAP